MGEVGERNISILVFLLHNIFQHCQSVYKIVKTLALTEGEKFVTDFYEKERKMDK